MNSDEAAFIALEAVDAALKRVLLESFATLPSWQRAIGRGADPDALLIAALREYLKILAATWDAWAVEEMTAEAYDHLLPCGFGGPCGEGARNRLALAMWQNEGPGN